jgi:hypothetical protein
MAIRSPSQHAFPWIFDKMANKQHHSCRMLNHPTPFPCEDLTWKFSVFGARVP